MSQAQFAKKLFLSRGLYNGLETGREAPSDWVVQQIDMLERLGASDSSVSRLANRAPETAESDLTTLRAALHAALDRTIAAAGDDRDRLGWIKVQLETHVSAPPAWSTLEKSNARADELLRHHYALERQAAAARRQA